MKDHQQTIAAMTREELELCLIAITDRFQDAHPNSDTYQWMKQVMEDWGLNNQVEFEPEDDE